MNGIVRNVPRDMARPDPERIGIQEDGEDRSDDEDPNATWVGYSDRLLFDGDVGSIKRRMLQAGILKNGTQRLKVLRAQYE